MLVAAACGADKDSASSNGTPSVTAGAKFGEKPTVSKGEGQPPKDLKVETLTKGTGATLAKGQSVQVNYFGQTWTSDKPFDTSFGKKPFTLTLGAGQVIKGWDQGLEGQKVGSRVKLTIPPNLGYGDQGQGESIPPKATLVFVVDILKATTIPTSAKGAVVKQDDAALPKVSTNADGKAPTVTVPKTDAPKNLVSNYVIEGSGAVVKKTDTIMTSYVAYLWKDGKQFDSSYTQGQPVSFPLDALKVKGLSEGLAGKKVGSRVLLVMPPAYGFGGQANQSIPANSTLVFSVDILAVV